MSSYDSGPASRISRASGTGNPRQEIATLATPGVVAPGPDLSKANQLEQLLHVLRGAGTAAEQYGQNVRMTEAEQRRQEAEQRRLDAEARAETRARMAEDRQAAAFDRNAALTDAGNKLPLLHEQIQAGQLRVGDFAAPGSDPAPVTQTPPYTDPIREQAFQNQYAAIAKDHGLNPNPDDPSHQYDYRKAIAAGEGPGPDGHWTSEFKLANHPNRFVDGIDTITGKPVDSQLPMVQKIQAIVAQDTIGQTPEYRAEYAKFMVPRLENEFRVQHESERKKAIGELSNVLVSGSQFTADSSVISGNMATYQKLNKVDNLTAATAVAVPAYMNAAEAGDPDRMNAAASLLPQQYFDKALREGQLKFNEVKTKRLTQAEKDFGDTISGLRISNAPQETVENTIQSSDAPAHVKETQLRETKTWYADQNMKLRAAEKQQAIGEVQSQYKSKAQSLADTNSLFALQNETVNLADGTKVELDAKKVQQQVTDEKYADLLNKYSDNPKQAMNKMLEFSSQQGFVPSQFKTVMNAGYAGTSISTAFTRDGGKGAPPELPPQSVEAYQIYKQARAFPGVLNQIGADAQAMQLWERTYTMQADPAYAKDDTRALLDSVRRGASPDHIEFTRNEKLKLDSAMKSLTDIPWSMKNAINGNEVRTWLYEMAAAKVEGGMDGKDALKAAQADWGTANVFIGRHAVNLSGLNIPTDQVPNIEAVAALKVKEYLDAGGKNLGYSAATLTFKPDRDTGLWTVRDASNNATAPTIDFVRNKKFATADQISMYHTELLKALPTAQVEVKKQDAAGFKNEIYEFWQRERNDPTPRFGSAKFPAGFMQGIAP